VREFREGKRQGSVISTQTMDSFSTSNKEAWRTIRKELEDIGIIVAAFNANKEFIFEWFLSAIECGAFEEHAADDSPTADKYVDSSEEALKNNSIPSRIYHGLSS
jgi:hypothetical protein